MVSNLAKKTMRACARRVFAPVFCAGSRPAAAATLCKTKALSFRLLSKVATGEYVSDNRHSGLVLDASVVSPVVWPMPESPHLSYDHLIEALAGKRLKSTWLSSYNLGTHHLLKSDAHGDALVQFHFSAARRYFALALREFDQEMDRLDDSQDVTPMHLRRRVDLPARGKPPFGAPSPSLQQLLRFLLLFNSSVAEGFINWSVAEGFINLSGIEEDFPPQVSVFPSPHTGHSRFCRVSSHLWETLSLAETLKNKSLQTSARVALGFGFLQQAAAGDENVFELALFHFFGALRIDSKCGLAHYGASCALRARSSRAADTRSRVSQRLAKDHWTMASSLLTGPTSPAHCARFGRQLMPANTSSPTAFLVGSHARRLLDVNPPRPVLTEVMPLIVPLTSASSFDLVIPPFSHILPFSFSS